MSLVIRIVTVSVLTILMACSPMLQQVRLPPERSFHRGYSLVPPNEKGWLIRERNHNSLVLGRYGSSPDETYVIQTMVWGLPSLTSQSEFINVVKEMNTIGTDPSRFTILKQDVAPYPRKGDYCARSHLMSVDRAAVKRTGGVHLMILEIVSLTCRHPANAKVAITVLYSHRHYSDHGDPALSEKAEKLFESVEFTSLR